MLLKKKLARKMLIEQRHVDDSGFRGMPLYHTTSVFGRSTIGSVARGAGGLEPPHWLVKYAKSHVFGAFKADFW